MDFYEEATQLCEQLDKQIADCNAGIDKLPDGHLVTSRTGNSYKYFHAHRNKRTGKMRKDYIPKAKRETASQLAYKRYLEWKVKELTQERDSVRQCIEDHENRGPLASEKIREDPYRRLIRPQNWLKPQADLAWAEEDFRQSAEYPEGKKIQTACGIYVRSKSEAIIANLLFSHGIPFRYEMLLSFGGTSYAPDFTIKVPSNGKIMYWEHYGNMDNSNYLQKTCIKRNDYLNHGLIPGVNMIETYETGDKPLNSIYVDWLIRFYLE